MRLKYPVNSAPPRRKRARGKVKKNVDGPKRIYEHDHAQRNVARHTKAHLSLLFRLLLHVSEEVLLPSVQRRPHSVREPAKIATQGDGRVVRKKVSKEGGRGDDDDIAVYQFCRYEQWLRSSVARKLQQKPFGRARTVLKRASPICYKTRPKRAIH